MATKKIKKGASEDTEDFVAVTPIRHNGEDYQIGEIITLTEKDGVPLLALGVIKISNEDLEDKDLEDEVLSPKSEAEIDQLNPEIEVEAKPEIEAM